MVQVLMIVCLDVGLSLLISEVLHLYLGIFWHESLRRLDSSHLQRRVHHAHPAGRLHG